jgi:hypothetical protein
MPQNANARMVAHRNGPKDRSPSTSLSANEVLEKLKTSKARRALRIIPPKTNPRLRAAL